MGVSETTERAAVVGKEADKYFLGDIFGVQGGVFGHWGFIEGPPDGVAHEGTVLDVEFGLRCVVALYTLSNKRCEFVGGCRVLLYVLRSHCFMIAETMPHSRFRFHLEENLGRGA